ncbi:MAG: DUF4852 domain-containing protein [Bdellovibrionales bacterium]|jgi:hypothetical protein
MKRVSFLLIVMMFLPLSHKVMAQEFAKPSFDNIVKTLIRAGAVDIYQDDVIDLYARVMHCPWYVESYHDDFSWEKKRQEMREEIRQNISTYPISYAYETAVKLGRYNFEERLYPFIGEDNKEINVNAFSMIVQDKSFCAGPKNFWLPSIYRLLLNKPVKMAGLYLSEEDGRALLQRMDAAGNPTHVLFLRVNVRVVFVAFLARPSDFSKSRAVLTRKNDLAGNAVVLQNIKSGSVQLDSRLESIEYFEDEAHTKPIYTYRPTTFSAY